MGRVSTRFSSSWSLTSRSVFVGLMTMRNSRPCGRHCGCWMNALTASDDSFISALPLMCTTSPRCGRTCANTLGSPCASAPWCATYDFCMPSVSTMRNPLSWFGLVGPVCRMCERRSESRNIVDHAPVPMMLASSVRAPMRLAACSTWKLPLADLVTEGAFVNSPGCGISCTCMVMSTQIWPIEMTVGSWSRCARILCRMSLSMCVGFLP